MKKRFISALIMMALSYAVIPLTIAHAEGTSVALTTSEVTITNNVGKPDTIYVTGVTKGDVITLYSAAGKVLSTKSVAGQNTSATISVAQLGIASGTVYMTVTSTGCSESTWTAISYSAEGASEAPLADNITITNNSGKVDTIYVCGLAPGDAINIYTAATDGKFLGTATVGANKTDVTKSISQLGVSEGSLYISVKSKGMHESSRVQAEYSAENQTSKIDSENVTITNNSGSNDKIYICGLAPKDKIQIYNASSGGSVLASATVTSGKTDVTISLSQLTTDSGDIYISNTSAGMLESKRASISYSDENQTTSVSEDNVTITNNSGTSDVIEVTGVSSGDTVNVYDESSDGSLLGSATASSDGSATITISQLGTNSGTVYISAKNSGKLESDRTSVDYSAESQSSAVSSGNIIVTNNSGDSDTVYVSGLSEGEVVNVYDAATKGNSLGSATVSSGSTDATVTISQLGTSAGSVYVSVTDTNKKASARVEADYSAEEQSDSVSTDDVVVTNNPTGTADTVYIAELNAGDVIKVYDSASGSTTIGTATVDDDSTEATISITQLGKSSGSVYITRTESGKGVSSRVQVDYSSENQTTALDSSKIIVNNNVGADDTIIVSGVSSNQIVYVYDATKGGNLLGSATVSSGSTSATVTVSQISSVAGSVYVSVKDTNKLVSDRVQVTYSAEEDSSTLDADNVVITNNVSGTADTVYISGLTSNDIVNVYDKASGGTLLGSGTVASGGDDATISITQLGKSSGSVYISRTGEDKSESSRVQVNYSAESQNSTLDSSKIVVNNNVGADDTIEVSGVSPNEVVYVYDAAKSGNLLGSATVSSGSTSATVTVSQLSSAAGNVYVSVKDTNKLESDRVQVAYSAEGGSSSIDTSNVVVTNNVSGTADTVYVSGLTKADIVNVYDKASGGTVLGTVTVASGSEDATISITQLGTAAGSVYISLTEENKSESSRVQIDYSEESKSTTLDSTNIVVTNNVGADDTVQVSGVSANQVINVYDAAKSGNLLGTATVASGSNSATVSISQLGSNSGSVYVSLIDTSKRESDRVEATYSSESESDSLSATNISVTNRSGSADTVTITGASQKDTISVYDLAKGGTLLGSVTVESGATKATISIDQIGTDAGSIYVSRTSSNKSESSRVQVDYTAEPQSTAPSASNIIATNNAGVDDTVVVKGLSVSDVVQVYDSASGGTVLGSATVASGATEATVSISQLGTDSGNIYVSITSTNKSESDRTQGSYTAEAQSTAPTASKITITNNAEIAGTVKVTGLTNGDIVKVYDSASGSTLLGSGTVTTYGTSTTVSVTQLGEDAGNVYISITSTGKTESSRTEAAYSAKTASTAPSTSSITATNNSGLSDTIKVTGLQPSDVINVYDASSGGEAIGTVTVGSSAYEGTVSIAQLGSSSGTIYVSVTSSGKTESSRTSVTYSGEAQSDPVDSGDVTIKNNSGTSDTIVVSGVSEGDVVKVYSVATDGTAISTATAASGESEVTVTVSQLGTSAGTAYVSVIRSGKTESSRTSVTYTAESTAPVEGNITIVNNADIADTITVAGLTSSSIVKVYDASTGGNLIGQASVGSGSTSATVTVSQLTEAAGSVYITATEFGKGESKRTNASYLAEQTSAALYSGNVEITNNPSGTSDTIIVSNLSGSDVIKVYDASTNGNLIGKATVSSNGTQVTITISQLSTAAGNVYLTVTNVGKSESSRIDIGYTAES